ncbi:MAG: hypothetical protein K8T89_18875 [Planctomycetes bacterium]|nr:hypothetical protein [Planctomycetota bacterium]
MSVVPETVERAEEYCRRKGLVLSNQLGFGVHGSVFAAENQTDGRRAAVKAHERERFYRRERNVYLRLKENSVTYIRGAAVPEMIGHDDELWVIEMLIVSRPFVLDFAGAYLDQPPDFSEDVLQDWRVAKLEQFGPRWPEVQAILRELESYEIYMVDVNPGNVSFGD